MIKEKEYWIVNGKKMYLGSERRARLIIGLGWFVYKVRRFFTSMNKAKINP